MARTLIIIGNIWLFVTGVIIAARWVYILYAYGFGKFLEVVSPFNNLNWIVVLITIAPGIGLVVWGNKLAKRQSRRELS